VSGPKVHVRGRDNPPSLPFSVKSSLGRSGDAGYDEEHGHGQGAVAVSRRGANM
jgi:hypothetical protein